tara:strand:+ start:76 stop:309 length:234 start_codon:yes stop_codon:yes gene_type:complete
MTADIIFMNGYGLFVWLSFGIVLISCIFLYIKTKKTLKKYEREFLKEIKALSDAERKVVLEKSKITSQILATNSRID